MSELPPRRLDAIRRVAKTHLLSTGTLDYPHLRRPRQLSGHRPDPPHRPSRRALSEVVACAPSLGPILRILDSRRESSAAAAEIVEARGALPACPRTEPGWPKAMIGGGRGARLSAARISGGKLFRRPEGTDAETRRSNGGRIQTMASGPARWPSLVAGMCLIATAFSHGRRSHLSHRPFATTISHARKASGRPYRHRHRVGSPGPMKSPRCSAEISTRSALSAVPGSRPDVAPRRHYNRTGHR